MDIDALDISGLSSKKHADIKVAGAENLKRIHSFKSADQVVPVSGSHPQVRLPDPAKRANYATAETHFRAEMFNKHWRIFGALSRNESSECQLMRRAQLIRL
jgi:hypothetical protein